METATAAQDFKKDYKGATRDALNRAQQELKVRKKTRKISSNWKMRRFMINSTTPEARAPSSLNMKMMVISGLKFGMVSQGSKIQSLISVAGNQVLMNLSEPSEFTMMHLDIYADDLRQAETRTESRALRAVLMTDGTGTMKLYGRYVVRYLDLYYDRQ